MTDITRRNLLKSSAMVPLLPYFPLISKDDKIEEEVIVYKFIPENRSYWSGATNPYCIKYNTDEWINSPCGKLFAFDTYENALNFRSNCIYKCIGKNVVECPKMLDCAVVSYKTWTNSGFIKDLMIDFWNNKPIDPRYICNTPPGTVGVGSIKILERVSK